MYDLCTVFQSGIFCNIQLTTFSLLVADMFIESMMHCFIMCNIHEFSHFLSDRMQNKLPSLG